MTDWNAGCERVLGCRSVECRQAAVDRVGREAYAHLDGALHKALAGRRTEPNQFVVRRWDGRTVATLIEVMPAADAIDDAPPIQLILQDATTQSELLAVRGFTVLEAPNGEEALRLLKANGRRNDALVTDVMMPGMKGPELA